MERIPKGRWTHTLIRTIKEWTTRDHVRFEYWIMQALSGHGCFGVYLSKYKKRSYPTWQNCGTGWGDAEHAFFRCRVYMEKRNQLQQSIGAPLEPETVVEVMLPGPESRDNIAGYFRHVITNKTEKEAEIQRMTNHGPSD